MAGFSTALSLWSDRHFKWLLVAPGIGLILALSVYPLLFSLWVNFVNYDFQIPGHAFVGLKNFSQVVFDPVARWSLALTVMLSAANVTIEFVLGLGLALAMVKPFPGRGLVMSILIIPLFISPVIVGQAWALLLQRPFGPTNYLLGQLLRREVTIGWLSESPWVYFALILSDVWQWTPFMFVILLAGLTSIPPNLYEASELDGIGGWRADEAGMPIDASGMLPDGTKFTGAEELRALLLRHGDEFVDTFTDKLLTYALGRGTEYYDGPAVRAIVRQARTSGFRMSSIVLGIVSSTPFQMRRTLDAEAANSRAQ